MIRLVYYLDVMSSWCYYAEPGLDRLRRKYGSQLDYQWRIALITEGLPTGYTHTQVAWFYKRSGSISGMHLNPDWCQGPHTSLQPNLVAEAAREMGFGDDRVRLALARAALIEGIPIYHKSDAVAVAAAACNCDDGELFELTSDPKIEERVRRSGAEFAAFGIDQRPAFVVQSGIGDRAIFSGIWRFEPLDAAIREMVADEQRYAEFATRNPPMPAAPPPRIR